MNKTAKTSHTIAESRRNAVCGVRNGKLHERKAIAMKQRKQAGMSGRGFYAALSLSVAMVGAACWYAWSEADRLRPQQMQNSHSAEPVRPREAVPAQTAPAVTRAPEAVRTQPVTEAAKDAEAAAAILRRKTEPVTEASAAETTAVPAPEVCLQTPLRPFSGDVVQRFSHGELIKSGTTGIWSTHNGADLAAPLGTEVLCTEDGTVTSAGADALFGVTVSVLHENGTVTRYCGLNENLCVQAGDVVLRGAVLGTVGDTNEAEHAEVPHLHFEVLRNDAYVDPESYFAGALSVQ